MEDLLQIGIITSTHGIKGEVKIFPTTDDNDRFKKLKSCFIEYKGEFLPVNAESCKFFKNMVILKFDNINDINEVEKYKQCKLYVDREHAVPLKKGEYFISDLIGMRVITDEERELGTLSEVISTGANDVYLVTDENQKEWLLPAIKDCILEINQKEKKVIVHLMKGMEE